jgi:16S rRNA (adenine1518-N6/adenine1519-N6)-dimethyltransferase
MKITDSFELKNYLRARGLKPKDYLGQNFLIDEHVLAEIIRIADLKPTETVLEVGPGLGVLTEELIKKVKEVIAVEKDPKLFTELKSKLIASASDRFNEPQSGRSRGSLSKVQIASSPPSFKLNYGSSQMRVINEDILRFHVSREILGAYKVVANIPYYLTSKLMQFFLSASDRPVSPGASQGGPSRDGEAARPPELMVLMVQKEVGERVTASPGDLSILGISVQIYADVEIAATVSKNSFWPVPEVDSVVLKIMPKNSAKGGSASGGKYPEIKDKKLFFRIVKAAFAGKRKMIQNTLAHGLKIEKEQIILLLKKAEIDPNTRPQDLAIEEWISLYQTVDKFLLGE